MRVWQGVGRTRKRKQEFQLTHPWWCDRRNYSDSVELPNFNSHTREGVTTAMYTALTWGRQFQLTHPWGCDGEVLYKSTSYDISTHTPVRVWPVSSLYLLLYTSFQLTHPWGCDEFLTTLSTERQDFNSHTREGVTFFNGRKNFRRYHFNSHTREGVTCKAELYNAR